jgi:hypothetical protein
MRIAKLALRGQFDPTLGIDEFLGAHAGEQPAKRKPSQSLIRGASRLSATRPALVAQPAIAFLVATLVAVGHPFCAS